MECGGDNYQTRDTIRRLWQESKQDKMAPRVGGGEVMRDGHMVRFCQKWEVELTRSPDGLGI